MMKKHWLTICVAFLFGGALVSLVQVFPSSGQAVKQTEVYAPKRILVPFMHMRGFGAGAGHDARANEDKIGAGSEIEIWNANENRPVTITEIYFTAPDGKTRYEGSKYGLPLPLELKPQTHYHFNSFYEHFTLPAHVIEKIDKSRKNFIHGYLVDIRWTGPAPRVRGWDLGVKDGQYYMGMPITVWAE
ncbi:MAG TPA: hypothetical protein VI750_02100 [Pyrinomonadaceae bacterium]|nr:hypothetical protein [Pyrinomonadaceae bacterium]